MHRCILKPRGFFRKLSICANPSPFFPSPDLANSDINQTISAEMTCTPCLYENMELQRGGWLAQECTLGSVRKTRAQGSGLKHIQAQVCCGQSRNPAWGLQEAEPETPRPVQLVHSVVLVFTSKVSDAKVSKLGHLCAFCFFYWNANKLASWMTLGTC